MHNAFAKSLPVWTQCSIDGFSFYFDLVNTEWRDTTIPNSPLHRVCTLMRKLEVAAFVREELDIGETTELSDEVEMIREARNIAAFSKPPEAIRFTFFREFDGAVNSWDTLCKHKAQAAAAVLGYVVLIKVYDATKTGDNLCYLLESVVHDPVRWTDKGAPREVCNYYVHCRRKFPSAIGTKLDHFTFDVRGSFFAQQNGVSHVCAHAALRSALHNLPGYDFVGKKLTNKAINEMLKIQPGHFEIQEDGLTVEHMQFVVSEMGYASHLADFFDDRGTDYQSFVYPFIESGFPVILGVDKDNETSHVVTILGHTLNTDRWPLEARRRSAHGVPYISTSEWADHFIAHDDNFGMYITLPTDDIGNVVISPGIDFIDNSRDLRTRYGTETLRELRARSVMNEIRKTVRRTAKLRAFVEALWSFRRSVPTLKASIALAVVPKSVVTNGFVVEEYALNCVRILLRGTRPENGGAMCPWFEELRAAARASSVEHVDDSKAKSSLAYRTLWLRKEQYLAALKEELSTISVGHFERLQQLLPEDFWVTEITLPDLYTGNKRKLGDVLIRSNVTADQYQRLEAVVFAWLPSVAWYGQKADADRDWTWPICKHIALLRGPCEPATGQDVW